MSKKGLIILSGGIDSVTTAYWMRENGYEIHGLSVDYGQRQQHEIELAKHHAGILEFAQHVLLHVNMGEVGGSYLTQPQAAPPSLQEEHEKKSYIVPARNLMFLSFASSMAIANKIPDIFIGFHADDFNDYPDCRDAFRVAAEQALNLQKNDDDRTEYRILAPYLHQKKHELIQDGIRMGVDYRKTTSCYRGGERPCLECHSCHETMDAFQQIGIDYAKYLEG